MTENLAGRGEGLAGLVAKWRAEIEKCCPVLFTDANSSFADASCRQQLRDVEELEAEIAALEAAARLPSVGQAPPSTPAILNAIGICLDALTKDNIGIIKAAIRHQLALATTSPQAPAEQSNAFSTTSAREQFAATAASGHGVEPECSCEKPTPTAAGRCFNCFLPLKGMGRDVEAQEPAGSGALREALVKAEEALDLAVTMHDKAGCSGETCSYPYDLQKMVRTACRAALSLSSPIEPTPSANSEVSRYFWDKAARWLDGQKMPPDLQRTMELAKLLEEVAADGATSQSFK